jgi:hypothetical protein
MLIAHSKETVVIYDTRHRLRRGVISMKFMSWKKCVLLLLTTCLIALFAVSLHLGICRAVPFHGSFEHRSSIPVYLSGEIAPSAADALRFIEDGVSAVAHTGDERSLAGAVPSSIKDNFSIDFIHKVPEPSTLLLVGSGLIGFALFARKRFKK